MAKKEILLIDTNDNAVGFAEKLEVHRKGLLHRAFSVLIFNDKGEILLQKRAKIKYHSGGLWSNACCGHPITKNVKTEAQKRLFEEMGLHCELEFQYKFIYRTEFDNRLIENELDYVFIGYTSEEPTLNPQEADEFCWISQTDLQKEIAENPEKYTVWFRKMVENLLK